MLTLSHTVTSSSSSWVLGLILAAIVLMIFWKITIRLLIGVLAVTFIAGLLSGAAFFINYLRQLHG